VSVVVARQEIAQHAMQEEVDYFWQMRAVDPAHEPPDESRLRGYVVDGGDESRLPQELRGLRPGMHSLRQQIVMVDERGPTRLVLAYPRTEMNVRSVKMVVAPLVLALLALAASALFTYRNARRIVAPLDWLARSVRDWDPMEPDPTVLGADRLPVDAGPEARQLAGALQRMAERMRAFVRRERDFTRDASHELRTPLTVIRVASDIMAADPEIPDRSRRAVARIQRAGHDMQSVIDAFFILARDAEVDAERERFDVHEVVDDEVEFARAQIGDKPIDLRVVDEGGGAVDAPRRVLSLMVGNLLSNAVRFTEAGVVEVILRADRIEVRDTGIGMSDETLAKAFDPFYRHDRDGGDGMGIGLSIVRRLGERFRWPVELESAPGQGTVATIHIPR
jgi:signal transduction histidine kinase